MCFAPQHATTGRTFSTSQLPEVVREWCGLYILTLKCASRHNGVHFFDTSTSKSVLRSWSVLYILTSKCASRHNGVQFFISHLATWLRTRRFSEVLFDPPEPQIIGKKSVSRLFYLFPHLHLLSSDSFSSEIFFLLLFSSRTLFTSAFHLSILSELWLLNFLRLNDIKCVCLPWFIDLPLQICVQWIGSVFWHSKKMTDAIAGSRNVKMNWPNKSHLSKLRNHMLPFSTYNLITFYNMLWPLTAIYSYL